MYFNYTLGTLHVYSVRSINPSQFFLPMELYHESSVTHPRVLSQMFSHRKRIISCLPAIINSFFLISQSEKRPSISLHCADFSFVNFLISPTRDNYNQFRRMIRWSSCSEYLLVVVVWFLISFFNLVLQYLFST